MLNSPVNATKPYMYAHTNQCEMYNVNGSNDSQWKKSSKLLNREF